MYAQLKQMWGDKHNIVDDFYIDMDGIADSSRSTSSNTMMGILIGLETIFPIVIFAAMVGIIMLYHMIGVKIGIFPPVFIGKKKEKAKEK